MPHRGWSQAEARIGNRLKPRGGGLTESRPAADAAIARVLSGRLAIMDALPVGAARQQARTMAIGAHAREESRLSVIDQWLPIPNPAARKARA